MYHIGQAFGEKKNKNKEKKERKGTLFALFQSGKKKVRTTNKGTASKTCILKIIDFVFLNSVVQVVAIDLIDLVL